MILRRNLGCLPVQRINRTVLLLPAQESPLEPSNKIPTPPFQPRRHLPFLDWLPVWISRLTRFTLARFSHHKSRFSLSALPQPLLLFSIHKLNTFVFTLLFVQMRMMEGKTEVRAYCVCLPPSLRWFLTWWSEGK